MSLNRPHTEEEKQKISQRLRGHPVSVATREKIGHANQIALLGRHASAEHREAIARGLRLSYQQKPRLPSSGHSEDTRRKISSGLRLSYETGKRVAVASENFRLAQKGRVRPSAEKERISAGLKSAYKNGRRKSKKGDPAHRESLAPKVASASKVGLLP